MKRYAGVTIIEAMLVTLISASIILFGVKQYLSYRTNVDVELVQTNVEAIFQAMASYYKVECSGPVNSSLVVTPGRLHPTNQKNGTLTSGNNIRTMNIQTRLITPGYLTLPLLANPIVNASGTGTNGYIAQFNQVSYSDKYICTDTNGGSAYGPDSPNCTQPTPIGKSLVWQAQVSVRLKTSLQANVYLQLLGGDCLSSINPASTSTVLPCSLSGNVGTFVVFQRFPTAMSPEAASTYSQSTANLNQFKDMYTTYPSASLTNGTKSNNQNYLCGS
jgi:hypothetical protein